MQLLERGNGLGDAHACAREVAWFEGTNSPFPLGKLSRESKLSRETLYWPCAILFLD